MIFQSERTNEEWLSSLRGDSIDEALEDLRQVLLRGLRAALATRIRSDFSSIVEDFVQEALIKILDNLDSFRGESRFTTWAQKIAVNVAFTELRRRRWQDVSLQELIEDQEGNEYTPAIMTAPDLTPEQQTTQIAMLEFVQRLINEELTDRQREAITAVMIGGMSVSEVARRMKTNRNALYKLIHDARQRLQRIMNEQGVSPQDVLSVFE